MKSKLFVLIALTGMILLGGALANKPQNQTVMQDNEYAGMWKEVEALNDKGLPRSALELVEQIYQKAVSENNAPQTVKSILYKVKLQSDFQEDYLPEAIQEVKDQISIAKPPVRQVLHSILAELYWGYYQSNRHRFMERSTIAGPVGSDIKTWDLKKILSETIDQYMASLEDPETLKKIPLENMDPILETKEGSKKFRPTLYDFLTHRAIDFFMNDESAITRPAETFEIDDPGFLEPAKKFVDLELSTGDSLSLKFYAMEILQDLLRFHLEDKDPEAFVDADLKRLLFVKQNARFAHSDSLYAEALIDLKKHYRDQGVSAEIDYALASFYYDQGRKYRPYAEEEYRWNLVRSLEYCESAIKENPGSYGAVNCMVIKEAILEKSISLTTEYANLPEKPFLSLLSFQNTGKVYFRIISMDYEEDKRIQSSHRREGLIDKYLTMKPEMEWSVDTKDPGDHQQHMAETGFPELPFGYYVVLASPDQGFVSRGNFIAYSSFWVSNIGFVSKKVPSGETELYVLARENGHPMKNVQVRSFYEEYDYSSRKYVQRDGPAFKTDESGFFTIPALPGQSRRLMLELNNGNDRFVSPNYFYQQQPYQKDHKTILKTYFFTDRAIYRPGQTVYFKGIILEYDGKDYRIKSGESTVVSFHDANHQKVSEQSYTTGDYGSFHGSFIAPVGVMNGNMQIRDKYGSVSFSVEEYKRPKFEVAFEPLQGVYKLDELVRATGHAKGFAGYNIDNARVSYRVTRQASFPYWRWWYGYFPQSQPVEISNGETTTDKDGRFTIEFEAIPDRTVDSKYKPVFNYSISASVTDINGETQDGATNVSVGATAMIVEMDVPETIMKQDPPAIKYSTNNLNGEKVPAEGTITISRLQAPEHILRAREWARPDIFLMTKEDFRKQFPRDVYDNEDDPGTWESVQEMMKLTFSSEKDSILELSDATSWPTGKYMLTLNTKDAFGEDIESKNLFTLYSGEPGPTPLPALSWFSMIKSSGEPGEKASFLVGSSEEDVMVIYTVMHEDKTINKEFIRLDKEQKLIEIPIKEEYRGNIGINLTSVLWNRSFQEEHVIDVPYTNKKLDIAFSTFRNKLKPGQEEEWQLTIRDKQGDKVAAEMLATMYDASLDEFRANQWIFSLYAQKRYFQGWDTRDAFKNQTSQVIRPPVGPGTSPMVREYDQLNWFGFSFYRFPGPMLQKGGARYALDAERVEEPMAGLQLFEGDAEQEDETMNEVPPTATPPPATPEPEEFPVQVRRDFRETAFFYPNLKTNEDGDVIISFTAPESLTRWKMMGLAYTKDLMTGQITEEAVTQKDLMVIPNPPRFFRQGDEMAFAAKVVNLSDRTLEGEASIEFFNAITMQPIDILQEEDATMSFTVSKGNSASLSWNIRIPDTEDVITYRIIARARNFSDGEEMAIPVLSNRMMVTETMPMPVNGGETKEFTFEKLVKQESKTSRNFKLTLEFTSNPAWYAIQALPYLMEYPYECSEQVFSRFYANSIASHIANSNPKIRRVFESWKNLTPDALLSNLEKNEELKTTILEATPWVMQAQNETERKQRVGLLFDLNHMAGNLGTAISKLTQAQLPNGGWPWFEGMRDNRYITQHIVTGFGHLDNLGVKDVRENRETWNMITKAVLYLDDRIREDFEKIQENFENYRDEKHINRLQIQYLYARSYFLDDIEINKRNMEAYSYFRGQAAKYWLDQDKYLQGMIALALNRIGVKSLPSEIIASLKEHALYDDEMGMYWRKEAGFYWYEAPIETQALMIEAFDEVAHDMESVEKMKIWLLKQKQTQDWETTKATTEACYALLLRGSDLLASDELVDIEVGDEEIDPRKMDGVQVEAGTGYFQTSWMGGDITPEMGNVTVTKKDEGIAWGAMYWQYFEDLDKITPAKTPLSINKKLFVEENTKSGPVIRALEDGETISVGDRIKVRIEINSDRDMEFIHLKDMRAAGFEPVNVLSGYHYQDGLGYYESTLDASVDFFIGILPRGTYVFEYPLVASQEGDFSNGITTIQCMYAPEFSSHSEGIRVEIE